VNLQQQLGSAWIREHIPHQGRMCLLERVLSWDRQELRCCSGSHRAADHPLRAHGRLGSACLIEYAAQAVAIHGALLRAQEAPAGAHELRRASAPTPPQEYTHGSAQALNSGAAGLLASARSVQLAVDRLDGIATDLLIEARRLHSDARSALYAFAVRTMALEASTPSHDSASPVQQDLLAQGRLTLWLLGPVGYPPRAEQ
jgi:predicted hotdog family 3-hydroxylacyl-ACP dehydratase